jgi:hypothetical protein
MDIPLDVRYKLKSLLNRYINIDNDVYNQKQHIQELQLHYRNTRLNTKRIESATDEKNKLFLDKCKSIRAVYLYLNRTKKCIFSFYNKSSRFWQITYERKKHLIQECQAIIDNNEYTEDIRKYLGLTIKTLEKYDENYGIKIGLVLNRLFCRDISWSIYEYL